MRHSAKAGCFFAVHRNVPDAIDIGNRMGYYKQIEVMNVSYEQSFTLKNGGGWKKIIYMEVLLWQAARQKTGHWTNYQGH